MCSILVHSLFRFGHFLEEKASPFVQNEGVNLGIICLKVKLFTIFRQAIFYFLTKTIIFI